MGVLERHDLVWKGKKKNIEVEDNGREGRRCGGVYRIVLCPAVLAVVVGGIPFVVAKKMITAGTVVVMSEAGVLEVLNNMQFSL